MLNARGVLTENMYFLTSTEQHTENIAQLTSMFHK